VTTPLSIKAKLAEYEYIIKLQMAKLEELAQENERLRTEGGAHAALKDVYLNPNSSEGNKIKAAAASLPFERPKLMSERAPLELAAEEEIIPLAQLVEQRRARQNALCPQSASDLPPIDVLPAIADGRSRDGNGNDSDH
jgi:hypothetical protein